MNLLDTILGFLGQKFGYVFTAVSGAFHMILSEIPDDEITILHSGMKAAGDALKAGKNPEEALTAALNVIEAGELGELSKLGMAFLNAFIEATATPSPTA